MPQKKHTSPVKGSTQDFLEIRDVVDDVVLLKDNSAVSIIEVGAVNFYLLSAEEQSSVIYAFSGLLNSLSFPAQVVIVSKKMDVSNYIEHVDQKISTQQNEKLKKTLLSYKEFIKSIIKKNSVLEKRFFFVIPFNPLEMGAVGVQKLSQEYIVTRAKTSLYPKRDHLLRLLAKIGLRANIAQKQDVVEFLYNIYNPSSVGRQLAPIETYTTRVMAQ
jgi:type IV secretory pathway VirB4 component